MDKPATFAFYYEGEKLEPTAALLEAAAATWATLDYSRTNRETGSFDTSLIENRIGRTIAVYWSR